ncbi:hypothetical protein KSP39_PZI021706 [Platanthera zijinensis]|uniref:Transmembrane protein n=1 Tax=Platanthera zijinensis TaxID=2320716 RepID=A0AAP0AY87_9ASPA
MAEEGSVIGCHTVDHWNQQLQLAIDTKSLGTRQPLLSTKSIVDPVDRSDSDSAAVVVCCFRLRHRCYLQDRAFSRLVFLLRPSTTLACRLLFWLGGSMLLLLFPFGIAAPVFRPRFAGRALLLLRMSLFFFFFPV